MKKIVLKIIFSLSFVFSINNNHSMNEASILINENEYSFLSTGHLYGAPQNIHSNHPSSSALGSEKLNSFSSKFMVLCGDIFKKAQIKYCSKTFKWICF